MTRRIKVSLPEGRLGIVLKDGPGCSNKILVKRILDESPLMGKFILLGSFLGDNFPNFNVLNLVFRFLMNLIRRENLRRGRDCWVLRKEG